MKRSKNYRAAAEKIEAGKAYTPREAIALAQEIATTKWDSTVDVSLRLGIDPRKADQMVRGTVNLPHGTGKTARVVVFATGDKAAEAEAATISHALGLPDRILEQPLKTLSGGQRRRLILARALVSTAPILLLDEPVEHVDTSTQEILDLLLDPQQLVGELPQRTILIVHHPRS